MAGSTFEQFMSEYVNGSAQGFLSDVTGTNNMHSGDNLNGDDVYSYKSRNRLNGFLGRINYDLMNRYLLTLSFRYDGTSRFSSDNKYAFFPSAAFAWRMSEEPFIKRIEQISDLKFRVGYGQMGNQGIDNYQTLNTLKAGGSAVFGNSLSQGVVQSRLPNTGLKWKPPPKQTWVSTSDSSITASQVASTYICVTPKISYSINPCHQPSASAT